MQDKLCLKELELGKITRRIDELNSSLEGGVE
jgi:hypothetical protein